MNKLRQAILILGDIIMAYASLWVTLFFGFFGEFEASIFYVHLYPFSLLFLCWIIIFYIFDLFNLNLSRDKMLFYPRFSEALLVCLVVGVGFFYLWPAFGITPKTNLLLAIGFFGLFTFLQHKLFYQLFGKYVKIELGFFGFNAQAEALAKEIIMRPYLGYQIKAIFADKTIKSKTLEGIKVFSTKKDFFGNLIKQKLDILIIAESPQNTQPLAKDIYQSLKTNIVFLNLADGYEIICKKIPVYFLRYNWFLENLKANKKWFSNKIKIAFDYIFACLFLILFSPFWAVIALAIKIEDKGKVFYKQKRVGKNKKEFWLFKFRSMQENAESNGAVFADKKDNRATKVGFVLRRLHLDELPQLINVLKGDISLVGPRPERPVFVEKLEKQIPHYNLRHLIKPGITGWDQIKFKYSRTLAESKEKLYFDLYYLKNRNLLLDVGILLKTFQSFFRNSD